MALAHSVTLKFLDGPKATETITVGKPAPEHLKLAIPEWVVYRLTDDGYETWLTGEMARAWRNPERTTFV